MADELFYATGKRKTSVARVWIRPGSGQRLINKKPMDQYLALESDRALTMEPLKITDMADKFDIYVNVKGGGNSGQAGAIRHGISRALVMADPNLRDTLKKQGFLTRDSRMKERKKYGQPGAHDRAGSSAVRRGQRDRPHRRPLLGQPTRAGHDPPLRPPGAPPLISDGPRPARPVAR